MMKLMVISESTRVAAKLYLTLLRHCLTRMVFLDGQWQNDLTGTVSTTLSLRAEGRDWPTEAETMVGLRRLENLEECIEVVLRDDVPGDLVETGVWRGGASIFMRGVLKAYSEQSRTVWLADSFAGLPPPDAQHYPQDANDPHHQYNPYLAVSVDAVKTNFERYGLLDGRVRFLVGWFKDTLPSAPMRRIAVLRLDGDMYESTLEALVNLYDRVSDGGFIIVDDYGALPNCRAAVEDFRKSRGICDLLYHVDWTGVFWRKGEGDVATKAAFDEDEYLGLNPDVAEAVKSGIFTTGLEHFNRYGRQEGRIGRFRYVP
jgi:hypothetical protein